VGALQDPLLLQPLQISPHSRLGSLQKIT
jgi:hypothetical protein